MTLSADDELAKIRAQRMAQIQTQLEEQAAAQTDAELEQQAQAAAIAELDNSMKRVLTPEARSRLASLNLVNPELTTRVKTHLATLANENRIPLPVNDQQLKKILAGLSESRRETSIRRI
ncbi:MAG: DNA-binding protein [Candidatus Poseidoniales archaeon]|nr:DNA-binding protein [Candidatus Poseidoniales archaeon]